MEFVAIYLVMYFITRFDWPISKLRPFDVIMFYSKPQYLSLDMTKSHYNDLI